MNNPISKVFLKRIFAATKSSHAVSHSKNARKQSGQTIVLVLAFAAVLSVGLLMIFNTSQQVIAKRELVNASDAAAYSGATILAQGLNFTASTNRAILANNALVGQMMSIRSTLAMSEWYWKTNTVLWKAIGSLTSWIPYLGAVAKAVSEGFSTFSNMFGKVVGVVRATAAMLQGISTGVIGLTNHALWFSQQVHLAESIAMFTPHMISIAKFNAPKSELDVAYTGSLFGPAATLGGLGMMLQPKIRKMERTYDDETKRENDKYLNYVTEENRNVHTAAYVGGRALMPNAISLWVAPPGCKNGTEYVNSAMYGPKPDYYPVANEILEAINLMKPLIGMVGEDYFCMYERHGGAELVQLKGGQIAWLAADVMNVNIPLLPRDLILGVDLANMPIAGGAAMSFGEATKAKQMDSIDKFIARVDESNGAMLGHQVALPADCVEFVAPTFVGGDTGFQMDKSADMQALSTNARTSGNCATLASGLEHYAVRKGLFKGDLAGTAGRVLLDRSGPLDLGPENLQGILKLQLSRLFNNAENEFRDTLGTATSNAQADVLAAATPPTPVIPTPQPGVSNCTNCAATTMATQVNANSLGKTLTDYAEKAKESYKGKARDLALKYLKVDEYKTAIKEALQRPTVEAPEAGNEAVSIGQVARTAIEAFFPAAEIAQDLINLMQRTVNDPVELPPKGLNEFYKVFSDGLPPWFWDVRVVDMNQGRNAFEKKYLVATDEEPNDYHQRRYNLGPVVYMALKQLPPRLTNFSVATKEDTELKSYEESSGSVLHSLGKARIFFRQPSDQWMNRYKVVVNSSLLLPFWQARNESLSYVEKWSLLSIQGLSTPSPSADSED